MCILTVYCLRCNRHHFEKLHGGAAPLLHYLLRSLALSFCVWLFRSALLSLTLARSKHARTHHVVRSAGLCSFSGPRALALACDGPMKLISCSKSGSNTDNATRPTDHLSTTYTDHRLLSRGLSQYIVWGERWGWGVSGQLEMTERTSQRGLDPHRGGPLNAQHPLAHGVLTCVVDHLSLGEAEPRQVSVPLCAQRLVPGRRYWQDGLCSVITWQNIITCTQKNTDKENKFPLPFKQSRD